MFKTCNLIMPKIGPKIAPGIRTSLALLCLALNILIVPTIYAAEEKDMTQYGFEESFPEIHAFISSHYMDFGKDGEHDGIPTFEPYDGIYLNISSRLRENLQAEVEWEYEHDKENVKVTKLLAKWKILENLDLHIGKEMVPITIGDRVYYNPLPMRKYIVRPFVLSEIVPMAWRDMGLHVHSKALVSNMVLNLRLSLTNGLGSDALSDILESRQNYDNNENKFISGQLSLKPMKGIEIGGSYGTGKYDDQGNYNIDFLAGHFIGEWKELNLIGEYVQSAVKNTSGTLNRFGYYAEISYRLFKDKSFNHLYYLEPVLRYDTIDPDKETEDNSDRSRVSMGLNVLPYEHFKFRVEYHIVNEKKAPQKSNNGFAAQVTIDF